MAINKQTLTVQLMHAETRIAELEAALTDANTRLDRARVIYRELRDENNVLRLVAKRIEPVITYYTDRAGVRWEKTRIGNRSSRKRVQCETK